MKALVAREPRRLQWEDVREPERRHEREVLVRPLAVARCDFDQILLSGFPKFPLPIHVGHEAVAEVVEGTDRFPAGQRVVVPFQISCGTCERCRRGMTGFCTTVGPQSYFGFGEQGGNWGGMLSDLALVPYADAMLVPLPDGVDPTTVASAADNLADGWRLVAPGLAEFPGAEVLIVSGGGGNSVPLYAVDVAMALGAASVTFVDTDHDRLTIARQLGAHVVEGEAERGLGKFLVTVNCTATTPGLLSAIRLTEPGGHCTSMAQIEPEAAMPMYELWNRSVRLHIAIAQARPAIPAILDLVAGGRLRPQLVTSVTASWEEAPEAMLEPAVKLVVSRESARPRARGMSPASVLDIFH